MDEAGLSAECIELMSTLAEFEIKTSGNGAAPTNDDCELGDVAENASYDPLALAEDTCWSKSDADATYLKFMTDAYIFDKDTDIRPWAKVSSKLFHFLLYLFKIKVPLACDIDKTVTVTPMSISVTEADLDDIGTTANPTTLSMKALIDETNTALTPADSVSLIVGETVFFFVETNLSSRLDLVLGTCTYKNDEITDASEYVMGMSNQITTDYVFGDDVAGFTMYIYQNSEASDMVLCDVSIGFAAPPAGPIVD